MNESRFEQGLRIRRSVVGPEYVDKAFSVAGEFGREFQELVTEYCWGASWGRGSLTRRDKSLLNLAIIGTLGRPDEFRLHVRGALRNGVSEAELQDTLIHLAIYAGIPAGVEAFRIAGEEISAARPSGPTEDLKSTRNDREERQETQHD